MVRANMRVAIASWAILGVAGLLTRAVFRVLPIALDSMAFEFQWYHWLIFVVWLAISAHAEGYRGFQKSFVPRVVSRAFFAGENPTLLRVVFAPAFAVGLFGATRKRMLISWTLILGIALLVMAMNYVPQPYRGIIDFGVVLGLGWGLLALSWQFVGGLLHGVPAPQDLPETDSRKPFLDTESQASSRR